MDVEKLVFGYIRNIELMLFCRIPNEIKNIILVFYPQRYKIASIGSISSQFVTIELKSSFFIANDLYYAFDHIYIKTLDNHIYTNHNQYNLDQQYILNTNFEKIRHFSNDIRLFESGKLHGFIITNKDEIYAFGDNKSCQFGNCSYNNKNNNKSLSNVILLESLSINRIFLQYNITKISCGDYHTLFLSKSSGYVWSCGWHKYGQCGINTINNCIIEPIQITAFTTFPSLTIDSDIKIMDICCGASHSLCLDRKHRIHGFGLNDNGQLAIEINSNTKRLKTPKLIPCFVTGKYKISKLLSSSLYHNIVINDDGQCWLFGFNKTGLIGNGTYGDIVYDAYLLQSNELINNIKIERASCSDDHTLLLSQDNKIYAFGLNINGQCQDKVEIKNNNPWDTNNTVKTMYFKNVCDPNCINQYIGINQNDVVVNIFAGRGYSSIICIDSEFT